MIYIDAALRDPKAAHGTSALQAENDQRNGIRPVGLCKTKESTRSESTA
jgi:hypothetical protein